MKNNRMMDAWREGRGYDRRMPNPYRMFEDFMSPWSTGFGDLTEGRLDFNPAVDVDETDTHYLMSFDLPGVRKDDLKIEIDGNTLTVSGERKHETEHKAGSRYTMERTYGRFERSFNLPTTVDPEQVEAAYEDGVLKLAIPKQEAPNARQVKIGERREGGFWDKFRGLTKDVAEKVEEKREAGKKEKTVA